jgi:hypothetical protein
MLMALQTPEETALTDVPEHFDVALMCEDGMGDMSARWLVNLADFETTIPLVGEINSASSSELD